MGAVRAVYQAASGLKGGFVRAAVLVLIVFAAAAVAAERQLMPVVPVPVFNHRAVPPPGG